MESIKSQLIDMGFAESKVRRAITACPDANTLEQVMEWLIAHDEELVNVVDEPSISIPGSSEKPSVDLPKAEKSSAQTSGTSEQPQLDATGATQEAVDMANKKSISVKEAERLIEERRKVREVDDRKKAIEDEKSRRMQGQKMAETRAELEAAERIRVAQQIRKERAEKELYHKQLMEQIARDREATRRSADGKNEAQTEPGVSAKRQDATVSKPSPTNKSYTECKIALRLPDGSSLVQSFSPQEQLAAVRLFIVMKFEEYASKEIVLSIPPKMRFTEKDMDETLEKLGLCPSARLIVQLK